MKHSITHRLITLGAALAVLGAVVAAGSGYTRAYQGDAVVYVPSGPPPAS